jgi:phosphoribosylformimino-5-aminoimidazole carboxamide ribotide isomerase
VRVLGVLDLMAGQVVRGVAGRRKEYQPVRSRLTPSCQPLDVACAYREHFGLTEVYLADLDAIAGTAPALRTYANLRSEGFRLWVDAGVREAADAVALAQAGVETVVVGLETVTGPQALAEAVGRLGSRLVFSLDLRDGMPLGDLAGWESSDALHIARKAVGMGVTRLLVLDLARVGVGGGPGGVALCRRLIAEFPHLEVSGGGGVRNRADLELLHAAGAQAVLVASSLHDGRLRREDLAGL